MKACEYCSKNPKATLLQIYNEKDPEAFCHGYSKVIYSESGEAVSAKAIAYCPVLKTEAELDGK